MEKSEAKQLLGIVAIGTVVIGGLALVFRILSERK